MTALPDAALRRVRTERGDAGVRRGVVNGNLREVRRVVAEEPAVIRIGVRIAGVGHVKNSARQRQRRALVRLLAVERHHAADAVRAGAGNGTAHDHGTITALRAVGDVKRVEAMDVICRDSGHDFARGDVDVKRAGRGINHRRAGDANLGNDVGKTRSAVTRAELAIRAQGRDAEVGFPKQAAVRACAAVGVKRIDRVMLARDIDDVAHADAGNVDTRHNQRLRVDVAVRDVFDEAAEIVRVDLRWREQNLVGVRAAAGVVVVIRQHRDDWSRRQRGERQRRLRPRRAIGVHGGSGEIINCVRHQSLRGDRKTAALRAEINAVRPRARVRAAVRRAVVKRDVRRADADGDNLAVQNRRRALHVGRRGNCDDGWIARRRGERA